MISIYYRPYIIRSTDLQILWTIIISWYDIAIKYIFEYCTYIAEKLGRIASNYS